MSGDVDAYFEKQAPEIQAIAQALRARIETLGPQLMCKLA